MRRLFLGVGLVFAFALGAVAQQDFIYAFRNGHVDLTTSAQPCAAGLKGAVAPMVYDRSAWLVYTCNDDRVILRRYLNPNDKVIAPMPVYTVPAPKLPSDPIGNPGEQTITCPDDPHPACKMLPAGTYRRDWADTVARH